MTAVVGADEANPPDANIRGRRNEIQSGQRRPERASLMLRFALEAGVLPLMGETVPFQLDGRGSELEREMVVSPLWNHNDPFPRQNVCVRWRRSR
jgi:hypothetical protein